MTKKVLLGLSGGVDSSVSAYLLKEQGYDVTGMFFLMSDQHVAMVADAQKCADFYGIPLVVRDLRVEFKEKIIDPFMSAYQLGETPNPCTNCNPKIKFTQLLEYADANGIDYIATGHYADVICLGERYALKNPLSFKKDQTYMLYALPQQVLSRIIFPLSKFEKTETRALAAKIGIFTAQKPDSQDVCFVPGDDYAGYIETHSGPSKPGNFIGPDGKVVGQHKGLIHYTVGQRKGLGIALGKPVFVKQIQEDTNEIILAFEGDNLCDFIFLSQVNYMSVSALNTPMEVQIKVRSTAIPVACVVEEVGDKVKVTFATPQKRPAPGQAAVFYKDSILVGGGVIVKE